MQLATTLRLCLAAAALTLAPAAADAQHRHHRARHHGSASVGSSPRRFARLSLAAVQGSTDEIVLPVTEVRARRRGPAEERPAARPERLCLSAPIEVRRVRGRDAPRWVGSLTDCAGRPTVRAMAALALLAQPLRTFTMNLPSAMNELRRVSSATGFNLADEAPQARARGRRSAAAQGAAAANLPRDPHTHDPIVEVSRGVRALHPRLLQLLQRIVTHFPGRAVEIVSGYRPGNSTSRHAHARALDLRVVGVRHEALRDFARTLPGAGVGFYPNSVFIHLDVRDTDEGNAYWTDYSGPGETPRYGHWPPTDQDVQNEVGWIVSNTGERLSNEARREWGYHGAPVRAAPPSSPSAPVASEDEDADER